jgi:hypothetical protein
MSRTWKIYTGNPVDPSCCTLQSGLLNPPFSSCQAGLQAIRPTSLDSLTACSWVEPRHTPDTISYLILYGYLFCTLCRSATPEKSSSVTCNEIKITLVFCESHLMTSPAALTHTRGRVSTQCISFSRYNQSDLFMPHHAL